MYATEGAVAGDDLNADKFWQDGTRVFVNGEASMHIENRPHDYGGFVFVITLGELGNATKYQVYMTRNNSCDIYVRYRNGATISSQGWKHITMT